MPALTRGCSVDIKSPRETSFSAHCLQVGSLKENLIHVVPKNLRLTSTQVATVPPIRKLAFTSSTAVHITPSKLAAGTMRKINSHHEATLLLLNSDEADLDPAVQATLSCKFRCVGQVCTVSGSRAVSICILTCKRLLECLTP